jgi:signal transduction histidine kinase
MDDVQPVMGLLTLQPMPKLAEALRARAERILSRWDHLVRALLPNADARTSKEVRNSIPKIMEQMAKALEADDPRPTEQLMELTKIHGLVRFHESYNLQEVIEEYRLLRRILVEEVDQAFAGVVSTREWVALDMAIDIALQQAVISFHQHQTAKLRSATEAEAKFLSFLAHDLRNGLNNIMLTMQWVEQSLRPAASWTEHADALRDARVSAEETIAGMERLLHAERLRKGVTAKREETHLRQVAATVAAAFRTAAEANGITIDIAIAADSVAHTDQGLLTVILQNLVGNAIKYSDRGTVQLSAIRNDNDNAWIIGVSDQGKGIAKEMLERLFDAFTRGETHGQAGVGLGLYIAAQGAKALGGKLTVDSTVNQGSTFQLNLPDTPAE